MLLAYLDEIGAPGPFIHPQHPKFADSPAFGYGGFIIPEENARQFGAFFAAKKKEFFEPSIPPGQDPGQWEKKGSDLLYARVYEERPENLRVLGSLISRLCQLNGKLFYYADEKPIGTRKETNCGPAEMLEREQHAMKEALNRIARYADREQRSVMVMMDQINEKTRKQRLADMYAHIFGRASQFEEMRRILEPPMHIDSELSSNIQFADWISALVKRAIEYQLVEDSRYSWIPDAEKRISATGKFTYDSKLHLYQRATADLHHSDIMYRDRPVLQIGSIATRNAEKLDRVRRASFGN